MRSAVSLSRPRLEQVSRPVCVLRGAPAAAHARIRPQIRKDYPLSLSISLSGGEETNQDFPSNGERTGKSPA